MKKILPVILAITFIIATGFTTSDNVNINSMNNRIITLENNIKSLKTNMANMTSRVDFIQDQCLEFQFINLINKKSVSNDFVVDTSSCYVSTKNNTVSLSIDLITQPAFSSHYIGNGRFDVSDRELKSSIVEISLETIRILSGYLDIYKFDKSKINIDISIKNYQIGSYINGIVKLEGDD